LGGEDFDVVTEARKRRPPGANVAVEAQGFVLCENEDAAQVGIDAIGEGDVNNALKSAKRDGGFGAIARERPQALALASCEEYSDGVAHVGHGSSLVDVS
jgi:hypothetical protein